MEKVLPCSVARRRIEDGYRTEQFSMLSKAVPIHTVRRDETVLSRRVGRCELVIIQCPSD